MSPRRRLTIKEVAEAAGVSTQTVSRVINNRPDVAPGTFERVQQVIRDTGYSPNLFARGLTQGRSHTLGVVAYGLEYFGPSRVLTGIEQQAAAMGYAISLNLIHEPETSDVGRLLSSLFSRQVDGIIWAVPDVGDNRTWSNVVGTDHPVPVLMVGGMGGQSLLGSIGIDNRAIGRLATEHLLAGGARHVGHHHRADGLVGVPSAPARLARVAAGAGPARDRTGRSSTATGARRAARTACTGCSSRSPALDAVFASNDQMALGVLHAAHRLGRRIPEELSVVGVDNIAESSHFWPALTTVDQPLRDAGGLAVRELDGAIRQARSARRGQDAAPAPSTLLQPQLVIRESSRPTP